MKGFHLCSRRTRNLRSLAQLATLSIVRDTTFAVGLIASFVALKLAALEVQRTAELMDIVTARLESSFTAGFL